MKFSTTWRFGGARSLGRIGAGTALPREFTARWEFPKDHTFEMDIAVEAGVPVCQAVRVIRNPELPSLSGAELRRIPFSNWVEFACVQVGLRLDHSTSEGSEGWAPIQDEADATSALEDVRTSRQRRSITSEHLQEVARVYRDNVDNNPTEAVKESFVVSASTAARWVGLARRRGLLGQTVKGKAGEQA